MMNNVVFKTTLIEISDRKEFLYQLYKTPHEGHIRGRT